MTLPSWPVGVPTKILRSSFRRPQPYIPPLATEMNGGNVRQRRQFAVALQKESVTIRMTRPEAVIFDGWAKATLGHGASRFTMPTPDLAGGTTIRTCWIEGGQYQVVPSDAADRWDVSFTLNVLVA